ncbi:MAG: HAMP domain-containing sensor histidine kinase [Anaerovoracaceae bacterium]
MVTKWKNTIKAMWKWTKTNKFFCLGVLTGILGVGLFTSMYSEMIFMSSRSVWLIGIWIMALMGLSVFAILSYALNKIYKNWEPQGETYYIQWKEKFKKQQVIIIIVTAIFAIIWAIPDGIYRYNYAMDYFLVAMIIALFIICEICVIRFMNKRLSLLMECMSEINKIKLGEAIKIERDSLAKAAKSEQMKVDLISNVSHDLKTPLTSMVGYIELMKKEELNDVMADYVDVISEKAEKLKEMIESLFSISKASSGNVKLNMEPIELNILIQQILADMSDQIDHSQLELVPILTSENTQFTTDNIHIYRICQNLIENALKYSAKGTRIFIKTSIKEVNSQSNVCFDITNTAGYFMDFDKEDVLERFARGDKARSTDGNGLGLAIVSAYTSALGGNFDLNIDCDQFKASLAFKKDI